MAAIRYPYTVSDFDRSGRKRWYVRFVVDGKYKKVRIRAVEGSEAWVAEYHAVLADLRNSDKAPSRSVHIPVYSLHWLINQYISSAEFSEAKPATQIQRRSILLRIARESGQGDCRTLTREAVQAGRDARSKTPGAANNMLKVVKHLYAWGIEAGHVSHNPAEGVKRLKAGESKWIPWTFEQRETFKAAHPIGTTARTAFHLAFDAGLRRSDVVRIGRQHRDETHLKIDQKKTGRRVSILVTSELAAALDQAPSSGLNYIETSHGKPYSEKGFGAAVRRWVSAAGLPSGLTLHGLRKADGVRMAESGATENEIAAKLGHSDTRSAAIYTKGADQQRLADAAIRKYMEQTVPQNFSAGQFTEENSMKSAPKIAGGGSGET
ncbi:MAG: tyrosine-type recombinase/integrase [Alphaproteobacteria bacterium]|nr:tyrosine-type recombinase/integrase [Alphaproteobacteria bacterium]MBU2083775.1 tyrosine-type recombinase/integrase [Alphaproteobacteria bacterium]MBU2142560.1 tyrosine-type recombinase/integrase [Alphaproteobacteria bacterium]MBU2197686.1 tyrosine-type recombinase/integrase [Alphaproteobacteria bacterium]MBU2272547.1 tyrosine-type recombinase/integrase [Alphaproteobacteria bacterium]